MNFKHLNFSAVLLVAVLAGCNGQPSAKENAGADSSSAPVLEDNTPAFDNIITQLDDSYTDGYNQSKSKRLVLTKTSKKQTL